MQRLITPRLGDGKDRRRLSDLVHLWFDRHGITLKDGEKRKKSMLWAAECMGSPLASEFSAQLFTAYRAKGLKGISLAQRELAKYRHGR